MLYRNIALAVCLMFLGVPAFSQQPATRSTTTPAVEHHESGMMPMQMWGMLSDQEIDRALTTLQGSLNLSATQVSSIRELARSRRESFRSAHDQAHPKWEQLMTLLKQPDPDPAAVGRIVVDMKKVHDQALAKQTDFEKQLSTVLNPTQQQIVNNLRANADTYAALQRIGLLETPEFMKAMSN